MQAMKDQPPPDLRYFKSYKRKIAHQRGQIPMMRLLQSADAGALTTAYIFATPRGNETAISWASRIFRLAPQPASSARRPGIQNC